MLLLKFLCPVEFVAGNLLETVFSYVMRPWILFSTYSVGQEKVAPPRF